MAIVVIAPFAVILIGFIILLSNGKARNSLRERYGILHSLDVKYKQPIIKHFGYYHTLSPRHKKIFLHRVSRFIGVKKFIVRGGLNQVTDEMVAMISATAVMLTMGLDQFTFHRFRKILIYPSDYYSKISQRYHKGEVNVRFGLIILSWEHFVKGFMDYKDGINLGVHELAHVLHLETRMRRREYSLLHQGLLKYWESHARSELLYIRSGQDHLFRPYAATNGEEFFAVALENFFERPQEFLEELPQLYKILMKLLNQDPARKQVFR